jgi:general stress protein 26
MPTGLFTEVTKDGKIDSKDLQLLIDEEGTSYTFRAVTGHVVNDKEGGGKTKVTFTQDDINI